MKKPKYETVKELIFYSYANLAMAHAAVERKHSKYGTFHYIIRAKLFKGLKDGTMNIRTIFDDEKIKLKTGQICNYCGANDNLALDHILPKKLVGIDAAENLIFACKKCNSSKGKKDLIEWMLFQNKFFPLMIIRRYLKLVYSYCVQNSILDHKIEDAKDLNLPFRIDLIPTTFPKPDSLTLNIVENQ